MDAADGAKSATVKVTGPDAKAVASAARMVTEMASKGYSAKVGTGGTLRVSRASCQFV